MPDEERLDAISEALSRLLHRQEEMEARMARIEAAVRIPEAPPPVPPPLPPPVQQPGPEPPPLPSAPLEAVIGLNWVNIVGVVTLIFGTAFFFKYAVDNNWVGPGARIALGIVAAMTSLYFGGRLWMRGQKTFGQGITGLGLALLYLSFWAAYALYHLVPQPAAFLFMVLTTAAAVVFAMQYESQAIAVVGILAGYWTPGALSSGTPDPWVLFSYVFLLNLACLALARMRPWRALEYLAALATVLWYGAWAFQSTAGDRLVATVFAVAFYAQFCFARERMLWAVAQLLGPVAILDIWRPAGRFLPLLLIYAAGGLIVAELRRWAESPAWTLACYWGAFAVWNSMTGAGDDAELRFAYITVGFALFFFWILWWAAIQKRALRNTDLLVMAANGAAYFGASYYLLNPGYHAYMGLFAAALGALNLVLAKLIWNPEAAAERATWPALLAVAVALTFLTLAAPIQFAGFRITIAWALEGAALAWISARFASPRMTIGAGVVLLLTVLRLFLVDTVFYASVTDLALFANPRFLTFAVTAASLFAAARLFPDRVRALTAYAWAHIVALIALGLELISLVRRSVAAGDQFQTITVSISILMATYALMLVTAGVLTKTPINRLLGLALMALCVMKLYMSDVWELGFLFRVAAFIGLGVLLLAMSYLYSRFRPAIEKLWKDDASA